MSTIADRVARIVAEQSGHKVESVKPESQLVADLGMDSLDIIETVMAAEEEFAVEISDEQADRLATVADITAIVEKGGAA